MQFRDHSVPIVWEISRTMLTIIGAFVGCFAFGILASRFAWFEILFIVGLITFITAAASLSYLHFRRLKREFEGLNKFDPDSWDDDDDDGVGSPVPLFPDFPLEGAGAKELPKGTQQDEPLKP